MLRKIVRYVCAHLKLVTSDVTAGEVRDNNGGSYMASFAAEQVGDRHACAHYAGIISGII